MPMTPRLQKRYRVASRVPGAPTSRFVAVDNETGEQVFIKFSANTGSIRHEAEVLSTLEHAGILKLKDWHDEPDGAFLAVEFVEGADLETMLLEQGGRLDPESLTKLLVKVADAVDVIHSLGFLHRDLKPANIIVDPEGRPIIADFGAATSIKELNNPPSDSLLTHGYAAPEQYLTDKPEGPWTDVYGLGAIAYRALTGTIPPAAKARIGGEATLPVSDVPSDSRQSLRRAIVSALAVEPLDRPQTVAAWRNALTDSAFSHAFDGSTAALESKAIDSYPPTVRVERTPAEDIPRNSTAPVAETISRVAGRHPLRALSWVMLFLAASVGLATVGWYGWPLYQRYIKSEWTVDQNGQGDTLSIGDAVARAGSGATVSIYPGTYVENLVIDRPIHLRAAWSDEAPLIAPESGPCLTATNSGGSVMGLRMKAAAPVESSEMPNPCLIVSGGDLRVEGNQVSSASGPAIVIGEGANPMVQGNVVEGGGGAGIIISAGARGTVTGNTVSNLEKSGLIVRSGADPEVSDNTFKATGSIVFVEGAKGMFRSNRIFFSHTSAIELSSGADPHVVDNMIRDAQEAGVFVHDQGRGVFEGNAIIASKLSGVVIASSGGTRLIGNSVTENGEHGIVIAGRARAYLERNIVENNKGNGVVIADNADIELKDNELTGNANPQLVDTRPR
jgi:parallel beta-helix repeat protein